MRRVSEKAALARGLSLPALPGHGELGPADAPPGAVPQLPLSGVAHAGTVLHGTRVPLRVWFLAAFFIGRRKTGISALQLQKDLALGSYKTAWLLLHKLRSALGNAAGYACAATWRPTRPMSGPSGSPARRAVCCEARASWRR